MQATSDIALATFNVTINDLPYECTAVNLQLIAIKKIRFTYRLWFSRYLGNSNLMIFSTILLILDTMQFKDIWMHASWVPLWNRVIRCIPASSVERVTICCDCVKKLSLKLLFTCLRRCPECATNIMRRKDLILHVFDKILFDFVVSISNFNICFVR